MTTATTANTNAEPHKTFFGKIIAAIGNFISHLISGAESAYNDLSSQQKQDLINGVNISQIIKTGYTQGEDFVVNEIDKVTGLTSDESTPIILTALKDMGINVTKIQDGLDQIANKVQSGLTDNGWNALWSDFAKFATTALSGGGLNWVSLGLGLIEFVFQHFVKAPASSNS